MNLRKKENYLTFEEYDTMIKSTSFEIFKKITQEGGFIE